MPRTHDPANDLLRQFAESAVWHQRFLRQVRQVVMTYLTQRWLVVGLGVTMLLTYLFLAIFLFNSPPWNHRVESALSGGVFIVIVWVVVAVQAKLQFAHSRAVLVPGFIRAHLAVIAALLLISLVAHPLFVAVSLRVNGLGTLALAAAVVAPLIWGFFSDVKWFFLSGGVAISAAMNVSIAKWWLLSLNPGPHLIILCIAWAAIAAWLWRLSQLREEQDEYRWKIAWPAAGRSRAVMAEHRRLIASQVTRSRSTMWICDRWHERLGGYHADKFYRIARLLRYGLGAAPIEFTAPFGIALYFAMSYGMSVILPTRGGPGESGPANTFWFQLVILIGVAGAAGGKWLAQRRPYIALDLLRPLTREQLVDGLMAASAWNTLICWLLVNAGMIIALWGFQSSYFSLGGIATLLLLSIAAATLMFGESFRLGLLDSQFKRLARMMPAYFVTIVLLVSWFNSRDNVSDWPFVGGAVVMFVLGVLSITRARRSWMNLELG